MRKIGCLSLSLLLVFSIILTGCSGKKEGSTSKQKNDRLQIYTSLYALEYFANRIGQNHVEVTNIMPPGGDAHTFEPTSKTLTKVADADLFLYSGTGIEVFIDPLKDAMKNENVTFVNASKGIDLLKVAGDQEHEGEKVGKDEHQHGEYDPHVWLDPVLSIQLAENIKNELIKKQPNNKTDFENNFASLKKDLENLNTKFKATIDQSPKKTILVTHEAYGYWVKRYGIEQIGISGLSTTNEPSQKTLEKLVAEAKSKQLHYVFFEQNVTPKVAKVIQQEIGAKSLTLHNLSSLTEENKKNNDDYLSLMNKNIETLKIGLQ